VQSGIVAHFQTTGWKLREYNCTGSGTWAIGKEPGCRWLAVPRKFDPANQEQYPSKDGHHAKLSAIGIDLVVANVKLF
jgi:hypothetical protein